MSAPALVALAPGGRDPESVATITALVAEVRALRPDLRVEVAEEVLPPMPTTVVALGRSEHMPRTPRTRHPHRTDEPARPAQPAETAKSPGHQPTASG